MKRLLSLLITVLMLITMTTGVFAENKIFHDDEWHTYHGNFFKLKVNDKLLDCEVPPIVFNDYSVVPARDVFEELGAEVLWEAKTQTVTVNYESTKIKLVINEKTATKNGRREVMPIASKLINGKTMIPVRYVGESLGFDVGFDSATDTVWVKEKPKAVGSEFETTLNTYTHTKKRDTVTVNFHFSSAVKYSHFMLKDPARIVIDTKETKQAATLKNLTETEYDDVTKIRIGQQPTGIRIVIDLSEELDYSVTSTGKKIVVKIGEIETIKPVPDDEEDEEIVEPEEPEKPEEPEEPQEPVIPDPPSYKPTRSVYLDAGHGGEDPGAIHTDEDGTIWRESHINLGVTLKVKEILEKNNVKVGMTREDDQTVELTARAPMANKAQTALFVSIHTNSIEGDKPHGIETLGDLNYSATYAGVTDKTLASNIQKAVIKKTGAHDRGIKERRELAVIRGSVMPSVLIEVGFISNPEEREFLFTEDYRQKLAEGIAEGILNTLKEMGL